MRHHLSTLAVMVVATGGPARGRLPWNGEVGVSIPRTGGRHEIQRSCAHSWMTMRVPDCSGRDQTP